MSKTEIDMYEQLTFRVYDDMILWYNVPLNLFFVTTAKLMKEAAKGDAICVFKSVSKSRFVHLRDKMMKSSKPCMNGETFQEFGMLSVYTPNGWIENPMFNGYLKGNFSARSGDINDPSLYHYYRMSDDEMKVADYLLKNSKEWNENREGRLERLTTGTGLPEEDVLATIKRLTQMKFINVD